MQIGSGGKQINGDTVLRRFYRLFSFFFLFQNEVEKQNFKKRNARRYQKASMMPIQCTPKTAHFSLKMFARNLSFIALNNDNVD
jgi:hypothetical protein